MITLLKPGSIEYPPGVGEEIIPVSYVLKFIGERLKGRGLESRILLLKAMTASGKSTTIPPLLYTEFTLGLYKYLPQDVQIDRSDKRRIICTQPRVITAQDIPIDIAANKFYHSFKIGYDIGYQTGIASERPVRSGLLFCTLQVLTQQIKLLPNDVFMQMYKFIIIDEAHERSLALDTTLFELKNFMQRNADDPRCPYLIIMSATFDPDHYGRYFGVNPDACKIIVRGFSYPVETCWLSRPVGLYEDEIARILREEIKEPQGDILIFVPGAAAYMRVVSKIEKICKEKRYVILNINRETINTNAVDKKNLSRPLSAIPGNPVRRVIIGTNVVETGVTLPDLKYVIDPGWVNVSEYNPWYGLECLIIKPAAQSMILQRKGRVGRKGPGTFYPLYTEATFAELREIQYPDVVKEDCTELILDIINRLCQTQEEGIKPENIDMLDNPGAVAVHRAFYKLFTLGFIEKNGELWRVTRLGRMAAKLTTRLKVEDVKMIMAGYAWNVAVIDLITIGVMNQFGRMKIEAKIFDELLELVFDSNEKYLFEYYKIMFCDEFMDNLVVYTGIRRKFKKLGYDIVKIKKWIEDSGLSYDSIVMIMETIDDTVTSFVMTGLNVFYNYDQRLEMQTPDYKSNDYIITFKQCIYEGFKLNLAVWNGKSYQTREGLEFNYSFNLPRLEEKEPVIPKRLLYNSVNLTYNQRGGGKYMIAPGLVSIIDGYVFDDPYYI
jgi:HrpA-like RNA helicase